MNSATPKNIDEYLSWQPEKVRSVLEKLRKTIIETAPGAEEVISYKMPAFKYHGILLYFAAFKNHCSLFAANSSLTDDMKAELKAYKTSAGTIQFTIDNPLPAALVKKIVKARMKQNLSKKK
ncbi:MAG: DUF1801 domain-containing protein [Ginsengibacter sp.]